MSRRQLSPTSFAILGLLSIQPFTTYELAQQMDRTVSWFWPRAASMIYEEPKKLVAEGLATSQVTFTGKRRSTVYEITDAGRASLGDWLDAPAAGMRMEFETMLKVAFADAGDVRQLRAAVREIRVDAETRLAEVLDGSTQYATTGGPFPDRLPIAAITGKLLISQYEAVVQWARWAEEAQQIEWSGVTPGNRCHGRPPSVGFQGGPRRIPEARQESPSTVSFQPTGKMRSQQCIFRSCVGTKIAGRRGDSGNCRGCWQKGSRARTRVQSLARHPDAIVNALRARRARELALVFADSLAGGTKPM